MEDQRSFSSALAHLSGPNKPTSGLMTFSQMPNSCKASLEREEGLLQLWLFNGYWYMAYRYRSIYMTMAGINRYIVYVERNLWGFSRGAPCPPLPMSGTARSTTLTAANGGFMLYARPSQQESIRSGQGHQRKYIQRCFRSFRPPSARAESHRTLNLRKTLETQTFYLTLSQPSMLWHP